MLTHKYDNVMEFSNVDTQDLRVKHEAFVMEPIHKRSEFVYYSREDVRKTQSICDGWLQRAKDAKLLAAQARSSTRGQGTLQSYRSSKTMKRSFSSITISSKGRRHGDGTYKGGSS